MQTINVAGFNKNSITDGPGLRFVIFAQGCVHHCAGCHNPSSHPFGTGEDFTTEELFQMIKKDPMIKGVTFSGGEPFCQPQGFAQLAKLLKQEGYEICSFSGFTFEELFENKEDPKFELLSYLDVLIDGKFQLEQKSLDLKFKGSSNQRTLDVPCSLAKGQAVLSTSSRWA